jgi:hypothetical protein
MSRPFPELRERLLRAGVAPRYVRRYLRELGDHLADLRAEEERAGRSPADAESAAFARLGGMDDLAKAVIERRQFQSWCARAPWAIYAVVPTLFLAAAWCVAGCMLWYGWKIFLPGASTPFIRIDGWREILYFNVGRLFYFGAPIFVGWGVALIAARQRSKCMWPAIGSILIALIGGMAQVHASGPVAPSGAGQVSIGFTPDYAIQAIPAGLAHASVLLALTILPYLIWRLKTAFFFAAA